MYEQYVLDLLSDVFFGGLASHFVKACLLFREIQTSHFGNPDLSFWKSRPLILEIPDLSFWKSQISLFGRSGPLSIGIRRSRAVSGCRHLCRTG